MPGQPSPFPHRLALSLSPRGGDYTLYFDVPGPRVPLKTVVVTIKQLEAFGAERDRGENRQADFGIDVSVDATTPASPSSLMSAGGRGRIQVWNCCSGSSWANWSTQLCHRL